MQTIPELTISFWPLFFLVAGGQGIFFSLLILTNKSQNKSNYYLSALLFLFGYMLIYNFSYWTNYRYHFPHFFLSNRVLNYLFGPLLLLYLDALRPQPKLQKWAWVHFVPAIIYFIFLAPFYFQSMEMKLQNYLGAIPFPVSRNYFFVQSMGKFEFFGAHLLLYLLWKWKLYFTILRPEENRNFSEETNLIRKNWLRLLLLLYTAFIASYFTYFLIADQPFFKLAYDYLISGIMTFSIYTIGFLGYKRPQIFSGDLLKKVFIAKKKYANSNLTEKAALSIKNALQKVLQEENVYRNSNLKMKDLAEKLNTSPHHLSQVINESFGKSFNQYINELRIKEALELLQDSHNDKSLIIQIAYQVGFNNKNTFSTAFKKYVGCTPKVYRAKLQKEKAAIRQNSRIKG